MLNISQKILILNLSTVYFRLVLKNMLSLKHQIILYQKYPKPNKANQNQTNQTSHIHQTKQTLLSFLSGSHQRGQFKKE